MAVISGVKTDAIQIGQSATDSQNFQLSANRDGTIKLARGAAGNLGDVLTVDAAGKVGLPQQTVSASTAATVTNKVAIVIGGVTYYLLASTSGA